MKPRRNRGSQETFRRQLLFILSKDGQLIRDPDRNRVSDSQGNYIQTSINYPRPRQTYSLSQADERWLHQARG